MTAAHCVLLALLLHSLSLFGAPFAQAQRVEEEHFRAGQQAFQAGEFERAVEEYKKVLRLDPTLPEAHVNLGLAYHSLGRYEEAAAEFHKAAGESPKLLSAQLFLGIDELKLGSYEKAAVALRKALAIDPANHEALQALASAELGQRHFASAAAQFRAIFKSERNQEEAWFGLGHGYLDMVKLLGDALSPTAQASAWSRRFTADLWSEKQEWNDAAREYQRAITLDPRQSGLHARLGMVYVAQQKALDAQEEFQKELAVDPYDETALLGTAESQLLNGETEPALKTVAEIWDADPAILAVAPDIPIINLTPEQASQLAQRLAPSAGTREGTPESLAASPTGAAAAAAHFLMAMLLRAAGDTAHAQAEQDALLQQYRQWQTAHAKEQATGVGRESCRQHRYTACAQWLQSQNTRTFDDNILLGKAFLKLHEDDRASDAFARALEQQPTNPEATYWLLRSYRRLADHSFAQLAEGFPDSWRVHQMKAEICLSSEQYSPAIQEYQLALEKQPGNAALHAALAGVYLKRKSVPEAGAEVDRALLIDPTLPEALYFKGEVCLAERNPGESIPYLQKALRRDPALLEAHATLGKAYLRVGNAQLAASELEKGLPLDHYGDLHFLLAQAYRQLGKTALAQKALARSQEMRKASEAADQAKLARASDTEEEGP